MRPIKFRAWHTPFKNGEMDEMVYGKANSLIAFSEMSPDDWLLEEYTGVNDKNGKEIYEGDIVHSKVPGLSGLGIVQWNSESACFEINDIRRHTAKRGYRKYPFYPDGIYRIDGNIHENPELLEDK